jgi:dihydrofolate synthase/folylpolyglutamate synthase
MSKSAYQETLDFLFQQLPMFQRIGPQAYKKDLTNTLALCKLCNQPHKKFKSIHIAGTNGKGSVSHMLAAILQTAGYKTGLYTSPHLRDFRERIRINGEMISETDVVDFTNRIKPDLGDLKPSFFEWTVAMAFDYFARKQVDIAVIEVGLGGRLDSTNVITPELSVITNIGWDHMDMLGDTLEKIAFEKAGIIKADVPVIIGESQDETSPVFEKMANEKRSLLKYADRLYQVKQQSESATTAHYAVKRLGKPLNDALACDLKGLYQEKNIATVLASVERLQQQGWSIEQEHIEKALSQVQQLTGFAGRWMNLGENPRILADTAHNQNGLTLVLHQLSRMEYTRLHMVIGVVQDKDLPKILPLFPKNAKYYFCKSSIPRALDENQLRETASLFGLEGAAFKDVATALEAAKNAAQSTDLIFVGGSTFTVADIC